MDALWRIQLLGAACAELDGQRVTHFRTQKTAVLLARLALYPRRAHAREELIDLLWPDADLDAGRNSLRVAIASLRRLLEPPSVPPGGVLVADRNFLRLNLAAFRCDAVDFEAALAEGALEQAAALYHGELLPGFYDEWILDERARLEALHEELALRRQEASSQRGLPTQAEAARSFGIPVEFTRFFGRERECREVDDLLHSADVRLLTLSGPGGGGKTRLSVEVARQTARSRSGPVCFVPLADLTDATLIPRAVADRLELPGTADGGPLDVIAAALADHMDALLVLDNFEHLVERGAPIVLSLLTRLPHLTCLVTSRRRLKLPGEYEYPVPALPLPAVDETPEQIARAASAQLFVDRARTARPDFRLTPGNATAVAALCRRLEGLPLALELVAARSQVLTPAQMVARLAQRPELFGAARRTGPERHRSLWAAMAWSYDLIPPPLQRFFARLSVFRGGCTVEMAEAVCDEPQALELLTQLRERSLIVADEAAAGMRFRLLETLREFAGEQLSPGEGRDLARRHAACLGALAAQMGLSRCGSEHDRALETLDAEIDNLRAALAFCRDEPSGGGWDAGMTGLSLAGWLGEYWSARGMLSEGLGWLESALERSEGAGSVRARALSEAGWLAAGQGNYERAEPWLTEALALARAADDLAAAAGALRRRGTMALWRGDNALAALDLQEALLLSRATGDGFLTAYALNSLGVLAEQWPGDMAQARELYAEALALFRECGDRRRAAYCLHNIGNIVFEAGDHAQAEEMLRESLALAEALGDHWHRAYCLRSLGDVAEARGDLAGAVRLLEEGRDLCRRLGDRMTGAGTLCSLGLVVRRQGNPTLAAAQYEAALALYREVGHDVGMSICQVCLAELAVSEQQWERAAHLLADPSFCRDSLSYGGLHVRFDAALQSARSALGHEMFAEIESRRA